MHHPPHLSFKFNHPSYLFNHTSDRNPLLIHSSSSTQCFCSCCCCYHPTNVSICDKLGLINPSFLCKGLKQSTLIHWSFCKRLIFYGRFKQSYAVTTSGVSSFIDLDREIRKKGFGGFGHKRKKQFLSNVSDDVEVMLNLLTDDVGLEYNDFRDSKKISKKHVSCVDKVKKIVGFRVVKRDEVSKEGVNDFEVQSDGHLGITTSSSECKNDLEKRDCKVCIDEVVGNVNRQQECVKEQAKVLDTVKGYSGESVVVSQDWRKKSEKRLNEECSESQSNGLVNIDNASRPQHSPKVDRIMDESGSRMKYKQFEEISDKDNSVIQYKNTKKKLKVSSEKSNLQEINSRRTSSSLSSKSRTKNREGNSMEVSEGVKEKKEEKLKKMDNNLIRLTTGSVEKSQRVLGISDTQASNSKDISVYEKSERDNLKASEDGSGSFCRKDGSSRHSSQGSEPKGPSDEMWHVTDASTTPEPSEIDAADHESDLSENSGAVKSNGRSLWTIIGNVVRFRKASPRSGSHTPNSAYGKGSPYVSANSEAWFSSHEPDASNDENVKKRSTKGLDSPLPSLNNNEGPSKTTSLRKIEEKSFPSEMHMKRSHEIKKTSKAGDLLTEISQIGASGNDTKSRELKRRLVYKDQVSKDNCDEWEEAYALEAKQRKIDEIFMREALMEAEKAADIWEVPVGSVLVHNGKIIARGYNLVEELRDSTAHAEMICIRKASANLCSWRLSNTTLYVTLEPCPMCAGAILQARIDTVVWGAPNKLLGADGSWIRLFCDSGEGSNSTLTDKPPAPPHPFHPNIVVRREVLAAECADVMQQFFRLRRKKITEPELQVQTPPSSITVSRNRHHSNLFSKIHHAFKIIFCL